MKKMLITGVSGLLGNNLGFYFKDKYDVTGWYCSHEVSIKGIKLQKMDIAGEGSLDDVIAACDPEVVLHCASLTDIDFCEKHKKDAHDVNVIATRRLVQSCKTTKIKFVYISTDAVYGGIHGDFVETDQVKPLNYYGITKHEGESVVFEKKNSVILRTNIFGWNIQNKYSIAEWVLYELLKKRPIKGFDDVFFSSIYTFDFAKILEEILKKDLSGIYNCASRTSLSKYEFACVLAKCFQLEDKLIQPISVDEFPFTAKRGKALTLNVAKLSHDSGIELPTIEKSLNNFYCDYMDGFADFIKGKQEKTWYPQLAHLSYGRQSIDEDDINAVIQVLKSSHLTQGSQAAEFEKALCDYTGAKYAVVFNSGTSALHCANLAAGVQENDEVITSPNTFVASANCIAYCNGKPVFADIDPQTYNINPLEMEKKINSATKAVIPVHFAGQSCAMEDIQHIVKQKQEQHGHKIYIIEDACHALGSVYKGHKVGLCRYSDMVIMSFHPVKHITTGEGGVVFTNSDELFRKLCRFRSHGTTNIPEELINKEMAYTSSGILNPWYYEQQFLGYNYRITDIQCALGISQLKKLPFFIKRRQEIVTIYNEAFNGNELIEIPYEAPECDSNRHLYVVCIDFTKINGGRSEFMQNLKEEGVHTQVHYIPVHMQPYYHGKFGYKYGDYPVAESYYNKAVSLPLYPGLKAKDVEKVVREVFSVMEKNMVCKERS